MITPLFLVIDRGEKLDLYMVIAKGTVIDSDGKSYTKKDLLFKDEIMKKQRVSRVKITAAATKEKAMIEQTTQILALTFEGVKNAKLVRLPPTFNLHLITRISN